MDIYSIKPYTYIIRCVPTGQVYYGMRSANKVPPIDDLWIYYFTSSKVVHSLIKEYGKGAFEVQIRKIFTTHKDAACWEKKVLTRMKVLSKSKIWLNRGIGGTLYNGYNRKGAKHTAETKAKISAANKGKISYHPTLEQRLAASIRQKGKLKPKGWHHTDETKIKIRQNRQGKIVSDLTRQKLSVAAKNRPSRQHSNETKEKMRESARRSHLLKPRKYIEETKDKN